MRRRACVLAGAIVCGVVAPATARAADPFGVTQLVQEVDAAVTQATSVAPHASQPPAVVPPDATKTLEAATKSLEVATEQAAAVASSAAAEAQRETTTAAVAATPRTAPQAPRKAGTVVKPHRRAHRVRATGRPWALRRAIRTALLPRSESTVARVLTTSPASVSAGRAERRGTPAAGAGREPTSRPLPSRSPQLPLPPQPGAMSTGQVGGHGPLPPPVIGALAALLLVMTFEFLPRALPPKAFRKPRRFKLPPWHPG